MHASTCQFCTYVDTSPMCVCVCVCVQREEVAESQGRYASAQEREQSQARAVVGLKEQETALKLSIEQVLTYMYTSLTVCTVPCPFRWYPFSPDSKLSDSGRKPWTIVRRFDQISFRTHSSSLEGATELKFPPFCSS